MMDMGSHSTLGKGSDSKSTGCRTIIGRAKKEETLVKKKWRDKYVSMYILRSIWVFVYMYIHVCKKTLW